MNLAVLRAQARDVATRQAARLQAAIDENRDLTAEEETADAADKAELARLTTQIRRAEEIVAAQQSIGVEPAPAPGATVPAQPRTGEGTNGFRDIAEFAQAVRLANPAAGSGFRMDDRLGAPTNVNMEQGDTAGSYLVPADFRQEIVDLVYQSEDDPIIRLIEPEPTSSNRVQGLGDNTTPWGTSGIQAYWRVEAEQMTPSKLGLTPRETKLNELYAFVLATEELLEDAPRVANLLTVKASAAIRWKSADAFVWADGIEKPLGWMASDALVTVSKETGQTADTIVRQNVAKMFARVINPTKSVWLVNGDTMPSLMDIKSDSGDPLWFPNYQAAPGGMLLGRPVHFTEHAATVGDKGDIQLINPMGYEAFRKQAGVQFAESIHLYFDYNIRAFRWIFRVGGQPVLSAPVEPARGSNTKSHFVALAARA